MNLKQLQKSIVTRHLGRKDLICQMMRYAKYSYVFPIPESYAQDICNLINNSISECDSKYGTNIGDTLFYTPDFLDDYRKRCMIDLGAAIDIDLGVDRVIGCNQQFTYPKRFWSGQWIEDEENPLYVSSMAVDSLFRGKNIGSKMLKKIAEEPGYSCVILRVDSPNEGAIRFYKKNGFSRKCEIRDPGPITIMRREFKDPEDTNYGDTSACDYPGYNSSLYLNLIKNSYDDSEPDLGEGPNPYFEM